jgi:tetratricopeptide (TPR) repeat protein
MSLMKIAIGTLFLLLTVALSTSSCFAASCTVTKTHEVSAAEQEFLRGHFEQAATLYRTQLEKAPNDDAATEGLTQALLRQQKIAEADTLATQAVARNGNSAVLYTALGEVQYREGKPWLAVDSAAKAARIDICYARLHLLSARTYRLNSLYASAAKELAIAHSLAPLDPAIRRQWLQTLPLARRIAELEAYLATDTGDDPEDLTHLKTYLASLQKQRDEPHKPCRLVSQAAATEIPLHGMTGDSNKVRFYGLDVKLNDRTARLQIDTGASGLVINRSVAEHAHLQRFISETSGGIGGTGETSSYMAYADSIRIGDLEFHDCPVRVIEAHNMSGIDGLIGMDVFSSFLVTVDFPLRKLALGTLPKRPEDTVVAASTLQTAQSADHEDSGDDEDAESKPTVPKPASASVQPPPPPPAPARLHGPRDRYVAPEMKDWTRVYRVNHLLLVPTMLNQSPARLMVLDTGAFSTTLEPAVARTVTKVHSDSSITVEGVTGTVDKVYTADEIEFRFANLRQKVNDVIAFSTPSISKNTGMEIAGFIGATALGQVTMSIDYRDGLVDFNYDPKRGYKYPGIP